MRKIEQWFRRLLCLFLIPIWGIEIIFGVLLFFVSMGLIDKTNGQMKTIKLFEKLWK